VEEEEVDGETTQTRMKASGARARMPVRAPTAAVVPAAGDHARGKSVSRCTSLESRLGGCAPPLVCAEPETLALGLPAPEPGIAGVGPAPADEDAPWP
jgi:hypothetical protein